jgi:hypothetical protein
VTGRRDAAVDVTNQEASFEKVQIPAFVGCVGIDDMALVQPRTHTRSMGIFNAGLV